MIKKTDVTLCLAMNNERGRNTGLAVAVTFEHNGDSILDLASVYAGNTKGVSVKISGNKMKFGRIEVDISEYKEFYGNMCWNAVWLSYQEAKRCIIYLAKRGTFACEGGLTKACEWWDKNRN